jgi:hypothetical protein
MRVVQRPGPGHLSMINCSRVSHISGRGRMRVIQRPGPGHYPLAMIPGQYVDHYKVKNGFF